MCFALYLETICMDKGETFFKHLSPTWKRSWLFSINDHLLKFYLYFLFLSFDVFFQENGINVTHVYNQSFVDVTWFRTHPHYQTYLNWSQSLVLGFIPVALLIYYNGRIYMDIRYDSYDILMLITWLLQYEAELSY